jgi:DNA-binding MarR family transcriptional regulator
MTRSSEAVAGVQAEFRRMSALSTLISHAIAERVGIHSTDMECLDVLLMSGPATAGQIADRTGLTTGAVTRLVDRLASRGLVRRREDPADRRRVIVEPVLDECRRVAGTHFDGLKAAFDAYLSQFNDSELESVRRFLAGANDVALEQLQALREQAAAVTDSAGTPAR